MVASRLDTHLDIIVPPHIEWEQIITLDYDPADHGLESALGALPPEHIEQIVAALEELEQTAAGQQILLRYSPNNPILIMRGGIVYGQRLNLAYREETAAGYYEPTAGAIIDHPLLVFDMEQLDQLGFYPLEGDAIVKPTLAEVLAHELAHVGDADFAKNNLATNLRHDLQEEIGIYFTRDPVEIEQDTEFFASLAMQQQDALLDIQEVMNHGWEVVAEMLREQKAPLLRENPMLNELLDLFALEREGTYASEHYAMQMTNIYREEAGIPYRRGAYEEGLFHPAISGHAPGIVEELPISADKLEESREAHAEWEAQHGEIMRDTEVITDDMLRDTEFFPADPIIDVPLDDGILQSFAAMDVQDHSPSPDPLTPEATISTQHAAQSIGGGGGIA